MVVLYSTSTTTGASLAVTVKVPKSYSPSAIAFKSASSGAILIVFSPTANLSA